MSEKKKTSVLVTDDEPALLSATARLLRSAGFDVLEATTGAECLQAAREHRPDLVLLDVMLPDRDGREVCRELKSDATLPGIFVALVAGQKTEETDRADGPELGADGYLTRPIDNRELLSWVRSFARIRRLEETLRRGESKYRTVADATTDWVYWEGPDGSIHYMSPSCEYFTGRGSQQFYDNPSLLHEIIVPEDRLVWDEHHRESHQAHKPGKVEFRIDRSDGEVVWIEHFCRPVLGEGGEFLGVRAANRDITDRKHVESERAITIELLSKAGAVESMNELLSGTVSVLQRWSGCEAVGIRLREGDDYPYFETQGFSSEFVLTENRLCATDPDGRLLIDESGAPILECMCGDVLRGRFDPTLPYFTEGGSFWTNSMTELLASTTEAERQGLIRRGCHKKGYESVALVPLGVAGQPIGLLQFCDGQKDVFSLPHIELFERLARSIALAISEQQAVESLRASESNLRSERQNLAEAQRIAHLGSWEFDFHTRQCTASDETFRIHGLDPQGHVIVYETMLDLVHPDDREAVNAAVSRTMEDPDAGYETQHRIVRPDGIERFVHSQGEVICDEQGAPVRMIGTTHDVTEQKNAEEALRAALEEISKLKEQLEKENIYLRDELKSSRDPGEIVGRSELLELSLGKVEHVADTKATVLLLGETGTGKELFARAVHEHSSRKDFPLVTVNCAALPSSLVESELFGHVKGAFTGALSDRVGRFESADRGSIFLDEIGELDLELQAKLLRVLQEGEFERIGSTETTSVDVRVIAATNRDLHRAVANGTFRADLYYRLSVFPIEIPPLRERREDIPLLVWHFISQKQGGLGKTIERIPAHSMNALVAYDWPGNVRELENVVERAMILSKDSTLKLDETLFNLSRRPKPDDMSTNLQDIERTSIVNVLEECDWKVKGEGNAADRLGLKPSTLRYRMKKLGIDRPTAGHKK